ncbi:MAG: hypothetical protein ACSHYB_01345 [Roseibacillus sp.]
MKFLSLLLFAGSAFAAPVLDLTDKKGNTLNAKVISITEKSVSVKRTEDNKLFKIPLSNLSAETVKLLKEKTKDLPAALPDYKIEFSVGKRRKKDGTYYVNQTISGKAVVKNTSREIDSPEVTVNIIIIGEDQRDDDLKCVLANQSFSISPPKLNEAEVQLKEFVTRYDSDNKGEGNLGGYQYSDYIILVTDKDGDHLASKSLNTSYDSVLSGNNVLAKKLLKVKDSTKFVGNLVFSTPK